MAHNALKVLLRITAQQLGYTGEKARAFVLCPDYDIVNVVFKEMTTNIWQGHEVPTMLVSQLTSIFSIAISED